MRLDLLVDRKVIIEVKATEKESAIHKAQVLTYLRLTGIKLGLVLNFGQLRLIDGLVRVVNHLLTLRRSSKNRSIKFIL
jgi:GxxExxY protein